MMGRHQKRKRSSKTADRLADKTNKVKLRKADEEKIKQSILEVFCTHPEAANKPTEKRTFKTKSPKGPRRRLHLDISSSSSDDTKTRRTSERQKLTKRTSKAKQTEKETQVDRHLKVARGFAYVGASDVPKEKSMTAICPGRVTRKFDLLQRGKKSAPAKRGCSESQMRTGCVNEEIKKLLGSSRSADKPALPTSTSMHNSVEVQTVNSDTASDSDADVDMSCSSATSTPANFPKKLDVRETVGGVLASSNLKSTTKMMYTARDLVQELTDGLQRLCEENAPDDETPTSFPLKAKSRVKGSSIQRSLTQSFQSCHEDKDVGNYSMVLHQFRPTVETAGKTRLNHETADNQRSGQTVVQENNDTASISMDTEPSNAVEFYKQNDLQARQTKPCHNPSVSSGPKSYVVSRHSYFKSRQGGRELCTESFPSSSSFPRKSGTRFNFYTERDLSDQCKENTRQPTDTNNNLQMLYNAAKFLGKEYGMLDNDRTKLKDDVAKSYRDNIKEVQDKQCDAFEAFFSENRNDGRDCFTQSSQEKASPNPAYFGREAAGPAVERMDVEGDGAVRILTEQLGRVHDLEMSSSQTLPQTRPAPASHTGTTLQLGRVHDLEMSSSQTLPHARPAPANHTDVLEDRDSRNGCQFSDKSRLQQLQIQQREVEPLMGMHSYMAAPQVPAAPCHRCHHPALGSLDFLDYVDHEQLVHSDGDVAAHLPVSPALRRSLHLDTGDPGRHGSSQEYSLSVSPPTLSQAARHTYTQPLSPWHQPGSLEQHSDTLRFKPLESQLPDSRRNMYNATHNVHDRPSPAQQQHVSPKQISWDHVLGRKPYQRPNFSPPSPDLFGRPRKMH